MRLRRVREGRAFTIWAINLSDRSDRIDCPALDFIANLTPESQKSMIALLERHAEHGQMRNEQKSKELDEGICEFKNRQGARLLYFYQPGRTTVLTHGFIKGSKKQTMREIRRAKELRSELEAAR